MPTDARRQLGSLGEQLACEHLERLGFRILERNYRTRWGELDLVACDGRALVFCEVKARRAGAASALEGVRPGKRRQVRLMASQWLSERTDRPHPPELRFDVIGVTVDARGALLRLDHLEGAF
jgi:putative endonuclease